MMSPFMLVLCTAAASFGFAGLPWQIPAALVIVCSLSLAEDTSLHSATKESAGSFRVIGTAFIEAGICCLAWAGGTTIGALTAA